MPAPVLLQVTGRDAKTAVETLKHYALQHKDGASLFDMLCQMEDKVCNMASSNKIQTGIRDYFTRFNADSFS
ncbi:hypothetical protein PoB_001392900 [Plakobranchus ocellatus]|uniref:Uncharacterized protein n=1 Tax=Plakobranchus ocellatus TaxID=259542 RepID=A0AAV3YZ68_9GAST|nr:hypothetical protein PoB_001392900 [Plakobranchus ocellatus]